MLHNHDRMADALENRMSAAAGCLQDGIDNVIHWFMEEQNSQRAMITGGAHRQLKHILVRFGNNVCLSVKEVHPLTISDNKTKIPPMGFQFLQQHRMWPTSTNVGHTVIFVVIDKNIRPSKRGKAENAEVSKIQQQFNIP
jgi:hypothetical protein